jgi:hypothetical protein
MFPRTAAECMPLPSRTPVMDSLARRYLEGGGGMWAGLTEKRKAVDPEMRADSVRVIIKCVRDWQKTDPDRCFKVRDHDGIMSVGELGILADAAEANLSNMAKLTRMFEYGVIEPTGEMLRAGVDALLTGVGDGRPATNRVERIWHAMEKARK